jgi:hypothetical protein
MGDTGARKESGHDISCPYNEEGTRCLRNSGQESAPLQEETLIIGMGMDLAEVGWIRAAIEQVGGAFLGQAFTTEE